MRRASLLSLSAFVLAAASIDCRCRKESVGDDKSAAPPAFSVSSIYELGDARVAGADLLVAARSKYSPEERMSYEEAVGLTTKGGARWRSRPAAHVLLGPSVKDAVVAVDSPPALNATSRQVTMLDAATGRAQRSFEVPRARAVWDTWLRDDATLFVIEAKTSDAPATLVAIDTTAGSVSWVHETTVVLDANHSTVIPAPPIFTPTSVHLFCRSIFEKSGYERDLCRFARSTGELTKSFPGPIVDASRSAASKKILILRDHEVEAVTDEGETLWKHALPENYYGKRVVAGDGWLVVLTSWVRKKDEHDERVIALDLGDGHELWAKQSSGGGEHFSSDLALSGDRAMFIANITPEIRVFDVRGNLVLGAPLKTQFVVSTEVVGGFVEVLNGEVVMTPSLLLLARDKVGLQGYRLP